MSVAVTKLVNPVRSSVFFIILEKLKPFFFHARAIVFLVAGLFRPQQSRRRGRETERTGGVLRVFLMGRVSLEIGPAATTSTPPSPVGIAEKDDGPRREEEHDGPIHALRRQKFIFENMI